MLHFCFCSEITINALNNFLSLMIVLFKCLKERRKRADKELPDTQKFDCVTVSLPPFKSALEDLMQRFSDALMLALRKSVVGHLRTVDDFLDEADEALNTRPHTIDEIGTAKKRWREIDARRGIWQQLEAEHCGLPSVFQCHGQRFGAEL